MSILAVSAAIAQDAPPPPPGGPGGPISGPPPMMKPLTRADVPAMVSQHFAMMDLNHDGVIDDVDRVAMVAKRRADREAEMKAHRDRMFAMLDTNRDGAISRQEFDAPPPPPPPPPPPGARGPDEGPGRPGPDRMAGPGRGPDGPRGPRERGPGPMGFGMGPRMIERADLNHDGKVTLAEAHKAALAAFDRADVNHDGTIDRDEMVVAMRDRMRDPGGPDGRGPREAPRGK